MEKDGPVVAVGATLPEAKPPSWWTPRTPAKNGVHVGLALISIPQAPMGGLVVASLVGENVMGGCQDEPSDFRNVPVHLSPMPASFSLMMSLTMASRTPSSGGGPVPLQAPESLSC